jgi:5'-nucleotidase / UDP-sugar diphosphatase
MKKDKTNLFAGLLGIVRFVAVVSVVSVVALGASVLGGCHGSENGGGGGDAGVTLDGGGDGGVGDAGPLEDADVTQVTVFHTADEHGWLEEHHETDPWVYGGAANVYAKWIVDEGFDPERHLLLSSGDNWTGPSISTWFEGQSMVELFNLMGYHATVIGNHEFDFGLSVLEERSGEAEFPFLSANIIHRDSGDPFDLSQPWVMLDADGVKVGVVGLTTTSTETSAHPMYVSGLEFLNYWETLDEVVPEMRAQGAQVILVLAHVCGEPLAATLQALNVEVDAAFAGHCHSFYDEEVAGVPVVSSGWGYRTYSVVTLDYSWPQGQVVGHDVRSGTVVYDSGEENPVIPDPGVDELVDEWRGKTDEVLNEVVGTTVTGIPLGSWLQANWVVDAWMWAFPQADAAISNCGGFRQSIASGDFTMGDIVGMMPFDNNIYLVEITGAELLENLEGAVFTCSELSSCYPAVSGLTFTTAGSSLEVTMDGGTPLDPGATYSVLVTDYIYSGGSGYLFYLQDADPTDLMVKYRDPVIEWTAALGTSAQDPVEDHIDATPRNIP